MILNVLLYLRPMKEGRTILEVLESFLKVELEDIRRYFGAEVPVRARKKELVD